jgi:transglutaminase-like putative cysteine protease
MRVFQAGMSQTIERIDDHTARITARAIRPDSPEQVVREAGPTDADRRSNNLIQSDDQRIKNLASQIAPGKTDPWNICRALESWVFREIRNKGFGQGMATAVDVAGTLEGDCTEHAVLLAALCRARGIATRAAVGLVYSTADQGFAFHMWNEAWVNDRWVPLDATLGRGGIGAAHLKLAHSDLSAERAEAAMLRVLQVLSQLQLQILEVEAD